MEKYTTTDLAAKDLLEKDKIVLTTDAYALTEAINNLSKQIERLANK
jgi:polyhydroxyalkanoate synthesis regulator phasin